MTSTEPSIVLLGGGTGTPKLLSAWDTDPPNLDVTVVANTGDDCAFGDLFVSPDVDSCLYAAAGMIDTETWWGLADDTTATADAIAEFDQPLSPDRAPGLRPAAAQTDGLAITRWRRFPPIPEFMTFGDRDRAIHRLRYAMLEAGYSLTTVTDRLADALGAPVPVVPMSDDAVSTIVHTPSGPMHFQTFWVAQEGTPAIESVEFRGSDQATPSDAMRTALDVADVVVIGPSNPVTSIGPMLALPGIRDRLRELPVLAVSPFVGSEAFSGPAAALMNAVGYEPSTAGLPQAYPFLDRVIVSDTEPTSLPVPMDRIDITIDGPADASRLWEQVHSSVQSLLV